jgi:hypothetical protein
MFLWEFEKGSVGKSSVALVAGSEMPPNFERFPVRLGAYEIWNAVIASDAVKNLFAPPRLQVGESTVMPDGKTTEVLFEIETRGLKTTWTQLSATCATPPNSAKRTIDVPARPMLRSCGGRLARSAQIACITRSRCSAQAWSFATTAALRPNRWPAGIPGPARCA